MIANPLADSCPHFVRESSQIWQSRPKWERLSFPLFPLEFPLRQRSKGSNLTSDVHVGTFALRISAEYSLGL